VAIRFRKRIRLAPGLHVNLSKKGISLSVGVRGAQITVGRRRVTKTLGIPGSGLSSTSTRRRAACESAGDAAPQSVRQEPAHVPNAARGRLYLAVIVALVGLGVYSCWSAP